MGVYSCTVEGLDVPVMVQCVRSGCKWLVFTTADVPVSSHPHYVDTLLSVGGMHAEAEMFSASTFVFVTKAMQTSLVHAAEAQNSVYDTKKGGTVVVQPQQTLQASGNAEEEEDDDDSVEETTSSSSKSAWEKRVYEERQRVTDLLKQNGVLAEFKKRKTLIYAQSAANVQSVPKLCIGRILARGSPGKMRIELVEGETGSVANKVMNIPCGSDRLSDAVLKYCTHGEVDAQFVPGGAPSSALTTTT